MIRMIQFVATAALVLTLALPSFAHETDHHRVTADILREIQGLRDDIDDLLDGNGNSGGNRSTDPGEGNPSRFYYGAIYSSLGKGCAHSYAGRASDYTSDSAARAAARSECIKGGGTACSFVTSFGSAFISGNRCGAVAHGGYVLNRNERRCAHRAGRGDTRSAAESNALRSCRSVTGVFTCAVLISGCTN